MDLKMLRLKMARAPEQTITVANVMDDPVRIYLTIKALLLKFKHQHQLQAMQHITIPLPTPPIRPPYSLPSPVTPHILLTQHQNTFSDLVRLISVKQYLGVGKERMLQKEMMGFINELDRVEEVLRCYVQLLSRQYQIGNMGCYHNIEEMMVQKVAGMKLLSNDFDCVASYLCKLPLLDYAIVELIGLLYEKAPSFTYFHSLFTLFKGITRSSLSTDHLISKLRICHPENEDFLTTVISEYGEAGRKKVLFSAEQVAKEKLRLLPFQLSQKDKCDLNFIIEALKYRLPLWQQLLQWEFQASAQASQYLQQRISPFLIETVQKQDCETILAVVMGQKREGWMGVLMARELLKEGGRELLAIKIIRKFLAHHVIAHQSLNFSLLECTALLFSQDLRLAEVVLELYSFPAMHIMTFCVGILGQSEPRRLQACFLGRLSQQHPVNFMQLYMGWYLMKRPETIVYQLANTMAVIMESRMTVQVALGVVRRLADFPPTPHLLCTLTRIFKVFTEGEELELLRTQVARCLNILLVNKQKHTLPAALKTTLHILIRTHLPNHKHSIFENVPEEVTNDLRYALAHKWRVTVDAL